MISVVLFDLDDTLFAHRQAVATGIVAHARSLGAAADQAESDIARWHALEEQHYHRYLAGELDYFGQRRARARGFVEPYGIALADDPAADAWYDAYFAEYERAWALHDDALRCLDALAGLRLGLITNGELDFQTQKLDATGLSSRFERVIASGEVGYTKPDPRIFEHACTAFGVAPAEAIYIGDRLQTDAIGAVTAGLAGVWLDRNGAASAEDLAAAAASAVPVIRTLDELPGLLATL